MPEIRWTWSPTQGSHRADAISLLAGGPLGIFSAILGGLASNLPGHGPHLGVTLDLTTGRISLDRTVPVSWGGRGHTLLERRLLGHADDAQRLLQQAYETGELPDGLPRQYHDVARQLIEIRRGEPRAPNAPNVPAPPFAPLPPAPPEFVKPPPGRRLPPGPKQPTEPPVEGLPLPDLDYAAAAANLGGIPVGITGLLPTGLTSAVGQQTPAAQRSLRATRSAGPRRRRGPAAVRRGRARKRTGAMLKRRRTGGKAHMVKGSPAAKRHMAKLRAMRKRRR